MQAKFAYFVNNLRMGTQHSALIYSTNVNVADSFSF